MSKVLFVVAALVALALVPGVSRADTVAPYDGTVGSGPWDLSSVGVSDSGIDVTFSTPIAFNAISTLSATFTDNVGGAGGGSPRFELVASNGDFFTVYLGTPPNFTDNPPATFTANYSGANLNNASTNSTYMYNYPLGTLASLEATPSYSLDQITDVYFIVDGGWSEAGNTQDLTLYSLNVNGNIYDTSATPLPAALPMFMGGLGIIGLLARRRMRSANCAALPNAVAE